MPRKILFLFLALLLPAGKAFSGYQASPTLTTVGTDSSNASASILRLRVTSVSSTNSNVSFRLEKADGTSFRRGKATLRFGCGTCTIVQQVIDTVDGRLSYDFTVYMPDYVTGTGSGSLFGRFESTHPESYGYWTWVGGITVTTYPISAPGSLTTSSLTTTSSRLSWGASAGANTYRYQVTNQSTFNTSGDGSSCSNCVANSTTTGSYSNISGLTAGTFYRWRVRAAHSESGQVSSWSSTQTFTTQQLVPTISNVSVSPTTLSAGMTQTVYWQSNNQAWYVFQLYKSDNTGPVSTAGFLSQDCIAAGSNGSDGCLGQTNPSSAEQDSWVVPSPALLQPGQYRIKVAIWSSVSVPPVGATSSTFTVVSPPPPTVSNVSVSPSLLAEGETLYLSWNASNQHHFSYMLYDTATSLPVDTSSFLHSSCPAGTGASGCIGFYTSSTQRSSSWLVPNAAPHGSFYIKMAVWDQYGTAVPGYSAPFTIGPTVTNVTLSPTTVRQGESQTISWTSTRQNWYMVMLYDSTHSGPIDTTIYSFPNCAAAGAGAGPGGCITQTKPSTAQSTSWTVPANLPIGQYTIKVAVWNNDTDSQGAYSAPFSVATPVAQISQLTLTPTPLRGGALQTVSWASQNQNLYEATLLSSAGTPIDTSAFLGAGCAGGSGSSGCIGKGTSAQSFTWAPPVGFAEGQYKVRVSVRYSAGDSPVLATSPLFDITRSYLNVSEWAQNAAAYLVAHGIVVAPTSGDLRGTSAMNRAELATMLYRTLGGGLTSADAFFDSAYGGVPAPVFSDVVDPDVWYHKPATYLGLLSYADDGASVTVFNQEPGIFRPAQGISRAWTLKALLEAINQAPLTTFGGITLFSDVPTSHPAAGYIYKTLQLGIIEYKPATPTYRPDEPTNREDLFVMLHRTLDSTANVGNISVPVDSPQEADFERSSNLGRIGHRYEQPILTGVQPPSFELSVFGPRQETLGTLAGIYTADLTADITSWDLGTHTDSQGFQYTAHLFCAWEATGGSFIDETSSGEPEFCSVKWVAPIDVSAAAGGAASYEITLYVGDGLGSEVRTVHQLTIGEPSSDPTLPTITLDPLPSGLVGGELLEFSGSVADTGDASAPNFGILEVEVFSSSDNGTTWSSRGRADLLGGQLWSHSWLLPPISGNRLFRAEATNLRGNRKVSATRSMTIEPKLTLEGQVVNSFGVPFVNAEVRLTGGGLNEIQLSDNHGNYRFENPAYSLLQGVAYQVEATVGSRHAAVAGLVFSATTTSYYNALRLDTAPPLTTATPDSGEYRDPIAVELVCVDYDTECAATYYTLDGTTPTFSSPAYIGPIAIAADTTLRFFSVDIEGNVEAASELYYTFDACKPPTSGDWVVSTSCTYTGSSVAPASVIVEPGVVLTIEPEAILEIDLKTYKLLVRQGGGVMVREGGTVRQTSGTLIP